MFTKKQEWTPDPEAMKQLVERMRYADDSLQRSAIADALIIVLTPPKRTWWQRLFQS